jgi:hypothetical protein
MALWIRNAPVVFLLRTLWYKRGEREKERKRERERERERVEGEEERERRRGKYSISCQKTSRNYF